MPTAKETEQVIIKGLNTHADTVDSRFTQSSYVIRCNIIGIAFYCKFNEIAEAEYGTDAVNDLTYLIRRKTRWRSASEIQGGNRSSLQVIMALLQLPAEGIYITCGFCLTSGGEEAAVYASTGTERDMDVNARHQEVSLNH
jgi:hypothetical protein